MWRGRVRHTIRPALGGRRIIKKKKHAVAESPIQAGASRLYPRDGRSDDANDRRDRRMPDRGNSKQGGRSSLSPDWKLRAGAVAPARKGRGGVRLSGLPFWPSATIRIKRRMTHNNNHRLLRRRRCDDERDIET